ncbi:hypothetical protein KQI63_01450 [bacterium]|nr:hypothetical protein [bacterium]
MRLFKKMLVGGLFFALAAGAYAQSPYRDTTTPSTRDILRQPINSSVSVGILDPSRINMSHSLGMGYSSGGGGMSQGYYMNTLSYRFDAPVLLRLRTGVTNNPFASSAGMTQPGESAMTQLFNNAEFFGGADILWKPADNVFLKVSVDKIPPGMYGYGYGGHPGMFGYSSRYRPTWYGADPFMIDPGFGLINSGR